MTDRPAEGEHHAYNDRARGITQPFDPDPVDDVLEAWYSDEPASQPDSPGDLSLLSAPG